MDSAGTNGVQRFVTQFSRSIVWQGWSEGRRNRNAGRLSQILGLWGLQRQNELWALRSVGTRDAPAPASAFGMLLNPVTSTPFSVNDIPGLEREHLSPDVLQLQRTPRSPETFSTCDRISQNSGSEVPSIGAQTDRRQERSAPSGDPCG